MTEFIVTTILLVLTLAASVAALVIAIRKKSGQGASADTPLSEEYFSNTLHEVEKGIKANIEAQERVLKESISATSGAQTKALGVYMDSISKTSAETQKAVSENFDKLTQKVDEKLASLGTQMETRLNKLDENVKNSLDKVREDNEKQLEKVRTDNARQLENMRATVDEKLSETLNKRLNESFETVQKSLESVYKGFGEMKQLGEQVSNMNKLLGGVKTRGSWGEVALESLLGDILVPEQYEKQCQITRGGSERVDFAVRMPGSEGKCFRGDISENFQRIRDEAGQEHTRQVYRRVHNGFCRNVSAFRKRVCGSGARYKFNGQTQARLQRGAVRTFHNGGAFEQLEDGLYHNETAKVEQGDSQSVRRFQKAV